MTVRNNWWVRGIAGAMLITAMLAMSALRPSTSAACDCSVSEECTWAGLCYSQGACSPTGHRSCQLSIGNPPACTWFPDNGC